ncbi:MAG TPA: ATP synthase F1 subunit epsilon [Tenuifilaceae bacterium]|nr:ATP synthase F1 subunit epsilon [Tenuifilaceae bacterium]HPE17041.1 ATP synthase F1 subunit epsilon [Tenuifilaceae bacterium]HPJ44674.1 ATP synthase F1 subunit epsilon [Tenuifilaceae bacterium]HPQ32938.1 ATP synthase F1 subunit epsilon [Tenuifilaceae bacterium]HRX66756.1 ATP synthase F1 subunit epsilon [Tenuifilaceae bacterium]
MQVEIITPSKIIFKGEAKLVRVPGTKGSFAMMRNHMPIISTLEPGIIKIKEAEKEHFFELVEPAIIEQHDNVVAILAEQVKEVSSNFI